MKMAVSMYRIGLRAAHNLERAALLSSTSVHNQIKYLNTKPVCNGTVCYLDKHGSREDVMERATSAVRRYSKHHGRHEDRRQTRSDSESDSDSDTECKGIDRWREREAAKFIHRATSAVRRYSKHHGRHEDRRQPRSDSESDSDSDTECKGIDRSEFWRRKMRTVHNILDVDKDGLISFSDFQLFAKRFVALGHLNEQQAKEFSEIIKLTWEEQWGAIDPYNYVTVEQYLEDMNHVLNDKSLKKKAHRWLPYIFKAVDKDNSGFISVNEFKLFFKCLGLDNEHAAVAFAVIDHNGDGKLSLKEFVKLGKDFFFTEDESRPSKMFWGPLRSL